MTTCYVTTDGGIYTCAELPEFKIGSVEAGLDVPRIREIIYLEDQEDTMCKNVNTLDIVKQEAVRWQIMKFTKMYINL